jgi:hypothetical protein
MAAMANVADHETNVLAQKKQSRAAIKAALKQMAKADMAAESERITTGAAAQY